MPPRSTAPQAERFDVLNAAGAPTGRTRRRDLVHRHGDWHRAFHCWIVVTEDEASPGVILQRRADDKDTWPGRLDVSVGGHYRAGETLTDVVREMSEEVGQLAPLSELHPLGPRIYVCDSESGIRDREIQDVFVWRAPVPFASFVPNPDEVAALELVAAADFLALAAGRITQIPSRQRRPDGTERASVVTTADLITSIDRYFLRAAVAIDLVLANYPHATI